MTLDESGLPESEAIRATPLEAVAAHRQAMLASIPRPKAKTVTADLMVLSEINPKEGMQQTWLDYYTQNWADCLADPLRLLKRSERKYEVVDGRHRLYAIRARGEKRYRFWCLVYEDLDRDQEAALFAYYNIMRRTVPEAEKFLISVMHGDPIALRVNCVLDELALKGQANCLGTMRNVVERAPDLDTGEMAVHFALRTLDEAFATDPPGKRFNSMLVKGFGSFYVRYCDHPHFDVEDLVERVVRGRKTAEQLRRYGQEVGSANEGAAGAIMRWLVERHDAGKRVRKLGK